MGDIAGPYDEFALWNHAYNVTAYIIHSSHGPTVVTYNKHRIEYMGWE